MKHSSRQQQAVKALDISNTANDLYFDKEADAAKFIKSWLSMPSGVEPEKIARAFLEENTGLLDVQEGLIESMKVSNIKKDKQGFSHVYFTQSLNDTPIF